MENRKLDNLVESVQAVKSILYLLESDLSQNQHERIYIDTLRVIQNILDGIKVDLEGIKIKAHNQEKMES